MDTHCLLWFQENDPKIPAYVMQEIQNPENIILFSQISLFEITIKQQIGKLPDFKSTIEEIYHQALSDNFNFLPITNQHIYNYCNIPLLRDHRDPFDRLLIATAMEEDAIMVTRDNNFRFYKDLIKILW